MMKIEIQFYDGKKQCDLVKIYSHILHSHAQCLLCREKPQNESNSFIVNHHKANYLLYNPRHGEPDFILSNPIVFCEKCIRSIKTPEIEETEEKIEIKSPVRISGFKKYPELNEAIGEVAEIKDDVCTVKTPFGESLEIPRQNLRVLEKLFYLKGSYYFTNQEITLNGTKYQAGSHPLPESLIGEELNVTFNTGETLQLYTDTCRICYEETGNSTKHGEPICSSCASNLTRCPFCRDTLEKCLLDEKKPELNIKELVKFVDESLFTLRKLGKLWHEINIVHSRYEIVKTTKGLSISLKKIKTEICRGGGVTRGGSSRSGYASIGGFSDGLWQGYGHQYSFGEIVGQGYYEAGKLKNAWWF